MTPAVAIARAAGGAGSAAEDLSHLLPVGCRVDGQARRLALLIDPEFLAEVGWNPARLVFTPPPGHRLLGRPICRAAGCDTTAMGGNRICQSCTQRLAAHRLTEEQISLLPARADPAHRIGPCLVIGCERERSSAAAGLCRAHRDQQNSLRVSVDQFLGDRRTRPLPALAGCAVASCPRQRRHPEGQYCEAHQMRSRRYRASPDFDETHWRLTDPPIGCGGQISLRGLPTLLVVQVVLGLQQRCRVDRVRTKEGDLRAVVDDLRRRQVTCLDDYSPPAGANLAFNGVFHGLAGHARRALITPEREVLGDVWDLTVFGQSGTVSFTAITQPWLREVGKRWAADDLPRRRVRTDRRNRVGLSVRHHIGALARLSESLRMRPDRGLVPAALGRADMEAFLHRLAFQAAGGTISNDARIRACREVRSVLTRIRAAGLTRPGAVAAGLGEDFTLTTADIPGKPEPADTGRGLPPEIMRELCSHLDALTSPVMRTAVVLAIDTGRRPEEICNLAFDCLARDDDGLPVLVYDNYKANRAARRLPISEQTATVITTQQNAVRSRYPHTSVGELKLLPTDRRDPDGRRAITAYSASFAHRVWVTKMPVLFTVDGTEYDKSRIVLYAYRHTYAQRHADAGVGIDVLRELMDHRKLDTTKGYYNPLELHQTGVTTVALRGLAA